MGWISGHGSQPTYFNSAFDFFPWVGLNGLSSYLTFILTSSFTLAELLRIYQNVKGVTQLYS